MLSPRQPKYAKKMLQIGISVSEEAFTRGGRSAYVLWENQTLKLGLVVKCTSVTDCPKD